jgi:hypothetical protein
MSSLQVAPTCPPGFDCAFLNSCPSFHLDCPAGFFCGSYENATHRAKIDFAYSTYATLYNPQETVTMSNADNYVPDGRVFQNACPAGFYCPDATTIKVNTIEYDNY